MYFSITDVKARDNYLLFLSFENGEQRIFDMKPYLDFGIFKELRDVNLFETVKISFDTIEWDNGADFDPEVLYEKSQRINMKNSGQKMM